MKIKLKPTNQYIQAKSLLELPLELAHNPPRIVAIDTEATGLRWEEKDKFYSLSCVFDWKGQRERYYIEYPVNPFSRIPDYNQQKGLNLFKNFIWCNHKVEKVMANAKYDWHIIVASLGSIWEPQGIIHDVLLSAWCCNTREQSYSLKTLSGKYLKRDRSDEQRLRDLTSYCRKLAKEKGYHCGPGISSIPEDYWLVSHFYPTNNLIKEYNVKDSDDALDLWYFYEEGMKELHVRETYNRERELMCVLYELEKRGIRFLEEVAIEELGKLNHEIMQLNFFLQNSCMKIIGKPLNLNSPKQLCELLYYNPKGFQFPILRWTDGGKTGKKSPKCDINVINELLDYNCNGNDRAKEFLENYLRWSSLEKGVDFIKQYVKYAVKDETVTLQDLPWLHQRKSIHTSFNQIFDNFDKSYGAASTGRLSSSNPNLQQAPDPTKKEHVIVDARKFLGPREGYYLYMVDLPQIELRIFAKRMGEINPENTLYKEFMKLEADPHRVTSETVEYLAKMKDRKLARQLGKHSNFTLANAGGKDALHIRYGIPLEQGELLVKGFYEANPEARQRQNNAMREAIARGYIETLTGRKINIDLSRDNQGRYAYAYRATAYDIQGSAKDLIREIMIEIQNYFNTFKQATNKPPEIDANILLTVHDELVFEIWKFHSYKWLLREIVEIAENVVKKYLPFPIKLELDKGINNWSSIEKKRVQL